MTPPPTSLPPQQVESAGPVKRPGLSVVVPCYQDEGGLEALFAALEPVLLGAEGGGELIIVDDGSADRTAAVARKLADSAPHDVTIVQLARNFGQHPAVFAGLAHAAGNVVVTMDSDLQYPAEEVPKLVAALSEDYPVVSGYRERRKDPMTRRWITRFLTGWLNKRTGSSLKDFGSMFRAYDRAVVDRMLLVTERHRYVPAVVAWLGVPIKEVAVAHRERAAGGSRYRIGTLVNMVLDLLTSYSVAPMRAVSLFGLGASALGFVGTAVFVGYRVIVGRGVSGTVSAFALLFFLIGVQLAVTAMIGEYVGRVYSEAKGRPYYIVGKVDRFAAGEPARES